MATNSRPTTAMLSVRVDADALREFDSFAVGRGGRSALVRQMIERTLQEGTERRSEEHTSELQSLMRISYAVFCLKKKNKTIIYQQATMKHNKYIIPKKTE